MSFKKTLYLTVLIACSICVSGQFRQPKLTRIDKSKGIESHIPDDMVLDKDYKYWIATYNGLISFDGNKFKTYHMPFYQDSLLGSDLVYNLCFENDSILWVGHVYGVARFNIYSKKFSLIPIAGMPSTTPHVFRAIFRDSKGNTFFCTMQSRLLIYNPSKKYIEEYEPFKDKIPDYVLNISEVEGGYYMLQTQEGLQLFDPLKKHIFSRADIPAAYRWIFHEQFSGYVNDYEEIGADKFISVLNQKREYHVFKYNTVQARLDTVPIIQKVGRLLAKDSFGRLWLYGFRDQVEVYDIKTNKVHVVPDMRINTADIDFSVAFRVFEDHEHNIWICTINGLYTFNEFQNNYELLTTKENENYYTDIAELSPGQIWIGTVDKGVFEYTGKGNTFKNYNFYERTKDRDFNEIKQILAQEHRQTVWLTGYKGRLTKYNRKDKTFQFYKDSLFVNTEICMVEDDKGQAYVGSFNGKIIAFNESTGTFSVALDMNTLPGRKNGVAINNMKHISGDWFCVGTTESGLIKINFRTKEFQVFELDPRNPNSIRGNFIMSLEKFGNDRVFGGTLNSVFCYNFKTNKIENFSFNNDYSLGYIVDLARDKEGNLILIGTNGMHLLNWETKNIIDLGKRSNIDKIQLNGIYYSRALDKVFISAEGPIYSLELNQNSYIPKFKPVIYSIVSYDKSYAISGRNEITLDKSHNSFEINFGASTYIFQEDLEYFYKLSDGDWVQASSKEVGFSKLPGGTYNFRLKVVYKGNRKISAETSLKIIIQKAYYEMAWFYSVMVLLASGLIYFIYRLRVNRLLAIERVRFQLSRDLHDDMGSTLSTINILSSIAGDKLDKDVPKTRGYINQISVNSQQMMESMDDIVWSINPANDDMNKVVYRMREFASGILEPKQIDLLFYSTGEINDLRLNMAHRRDFFLIFKEAINNAAKYSECTKIKVSLSIDKKTLRLEIKDNGKGFELKEYQDGNGLVNMKKRASQLKGYFKIESEINQGTTITLNMNLNKL